MALRVATCQFPTSADVDANADHVAALMREAKDGGAHLAHFCEGALSGYVPHDLASTDAIDSSASRHARARSSRSPASSASGSWSARRTA